MNNHVPPPYMSELGIEVGSERWVGTWDPFAPQLMVTNGPSLDELRLAMQNEAAISLTFSSRTADMEEDEPDDELGIITAEVIELFELRKGVVCFFAYVERGSLGEDRKNAHWDFGDTIWVWDYDGESFENGADFMV